MLKKILLVVVVAFVLYYVLHSPSLAGHQAQGAARHLWHDAGQAAHSLTKFFNSLF